MPPCVVEEECDRSVPEHDAPSCWTEFSPLLSSLSRVLEVVCRQTPYCNLTHVTWQASPNRCSGTVSSSGNTTHKDTVLENQVYC